MRGGVRGIHPAWEYGEGPLRFLPLFGTGMPLGTRTGYLWSPTPPTNHQAAYATKLAHAGIVLAFLLTGHFFLAPNGKCIPHLHEGRKRGGELLVALGLIEISPGLCGRQGALGLKEGPGREVHRDAMGPGGPVAFFSGSGLSK